MAAGKRGKVKGCKMNSLVAGIDLGDRESLTTVLSPIGDVTDRFTFPMNEEGYAYFASRVPKEARVVRVYDNGLPNHAGAQDSWVQGCHRCAS